MTRFNANRFVQISPLDKARLASTFPTAQDIYLENVADLDRATHFELRPICDGDPYTVTTYFYGDDTNGVQIRMGSMGRPSELVALYDGDDIAEACDEFFDLSIYDQSMWYNGNDLYAEVSHKIDMVTQIAKNSLECDEDGLIELLSSTGLSDEEQLIVRAAL